MKRLACHFIGLFFLLSCLNTGLMATENEPKYKNPSPTFKPLTVEAAAKLSKARLGKAPKLSGDEKKQIAKRKVVTRALPSEGEAKRYEAIATIDAPPAKVMAFLKSFDRHVGPMPHLEKVTYSWDGALATVEQTLKVAFTTIWYRLHIMHYGDNVIEWEYLQGDIRETTGYYKFFPYAKGKRTLIVYHVYTDPGLPIPQFIIDLLTKSSMPDVIEAVRKAVETRK